VHNLAKGLTNQQYIANKQAFCLVECDSLWYILKHLNDYQTENIHVINVVQTRCPFAEPDMLSIQTLNINHSIKHVFSVYGNARLITIDSAMQPFTGSLI